MKGLAILVILLLVVLCVWYAVIRLSEAKPARDNKRASWRVTPRSLPSGEKQIWITCKGEQDFLQWDEREAPRKPEDSIARQQQFEMAMLDAEIQAREFNRLRKAGMKEIRP
jgi:hypothetical protein